MSHHQRRKENKDLLQLSDPFFLIKTPLSNYWNWSSCLLHQVCKAVTLCYTFPRTSTPPAASGPPWGLWTVRHVRPHGSHRDISNSHPLLLSSTTPPQLVRMPHNYSKPKSYPNPSFLAPSAIPPVLPPSVEEAYRRKCIQLRSRTQTVSDANDAARIRLLRMRRGIEKMRLERAFLLEQVARRVKPNDDSSDGSPSPPPTVGNYPTLLFIHIYPTYA